MTKMTFLSPHSDDIAFSCAGAIQNNIEKWDVTILTIFSRSRYTHAHALDNDPETVTAARMQEDRDYCDSIGATYRYVGFSEGNLRGYPDLRSLYHNESGTDDRDFESIKHSVADILSNDPEAIIWSPIGLGHHIEHLITVQIALDLEREGREVRFYEDLPYASEFTMEHIDALVNDTLGKRTPVYSDITDTLDHKLQALQLYPSQISETLLEAIAEQSRRYTATDHRRYERAWK